MLFNLQSEYSPQGDQPSAIKDLIKGIRSGKNKQTLLGATGTGKTFTVANVIQEIQKPTLILAHNKTLAAQLANEFKELFPDNAVHYFVSYYDYYQPEAYVPSSDTFIEKEAQINEEIDRLRHASTQALLTRDDVIIVASVSCIYGLGSPVEYKKYHLNISQGDEMSRRSLTEQLVGIYYSRTNADLTPGTFRAIGNNIEVMPVHDKDIIRFELQGNVVSKIILLDGVSRSYIEESVPNIFIFPAKHFVADKEVIERAVKDIAAEAKLQLKKFEKEGKVLEFERLKRRTQYDLALIREVGYCNGIENYSAVFDGRKPGEAPDTLLSYFPHKEDGSADFLTIIDESHVTVPQVGAMYNGDRARKTTLVEHGFRLPSALDNRPLRFDEFDDRIDNVIYVSATPGKYEKEHAPDPAQQIIRPTGLIDPLLDVKPVTPNKKYGGQVQDFIKEAEKDIKKGGRILATTLTKRMAEDLTEYLTDKKIKTAYIHSDVKTMERIEIIRDFRKGIYDVLVGVNLLREGLDMPEVTLIGILDADKEGFLRSDTALIQTIGRAARNENGRVILYADRITGSMERAIGETQRRRDIQIAYNKKHGITPKTIIKNIHDIAEHIKSDHQKAVSSILEVDKALFQDNPKKLIKEKEARMNAAAKELDYETAAILRDELAVLYKTYEELVKGKEKAKTTQRKRSETRQEKRLKKEGTQVVGKKVKDETVEGFENV